IKKEHADCKNLKYKASNGWFDRFKKRENLVDLKFTDESASADKVAARPYP
ncbi:hypothetical protein BB559_006912, partial [Furculomyces boomerangus]